MGYKALKDANRQDEKIQRPRHESIDKLHIALFNGTAEDIKSIIDDISYQVDDLFEYCDKHSTARVIRHILKQRMDDIEFLQSFNAYYFCLKHNMYNEMMKLVEDGVQIKSEHMEKVFFLIYECSYNETIEYFINDVVSFDVIIKFTSFDDINESIEIDRKEWTYENHINYKLLQIMKDVFEFEFIKHCKGQEFNWKNLLNFVMRDDLENE